MNFEALLQNIMYVQYMTVPYLPKCTEFFLKILENKNLFQILGYTGFCMGSTKLANFSLTGF